MFACRALLRAVKPTTGIAGLEVVPNAREVLISRCHEMLSAVSEIPAEAEYRKNVEKIAKFRLQACQENNSVEAIEAVIGSGQVEEFIQEADDELKLITKMKEWKPWEGQAPPLEEVE